MKTSFTLKLFFCLYLLSLLPLMGFSQCPEGDVAFRNQADIDAFKAQYPNCKNLKESLFITSSNDIVDLSNLPKIRTIREQLFIRGNDALTSLSGLDSLFQIGTELVIEDNSALQSLQGLGKLKEIGQDCKIERNPVLSSLQGLDALERIDGNLWLFWDDALTDLSGLGSLTQIGGSLLVKVNENLKNFNGLGALDSLGGSLDVDSNPELVDFTGLEHLRRIDEYLMIVENPKLFNMQGLSQLASIGKRLILLNNPSIQNFSGLTNLQEIGDGLLIWRNQQIKNCLGLESLEVINGYGLSFQDNANLSQLAGLESLREVYFLNIFDCPKLIDLQGFQSPIRIFGGIQLLGNQQLESLRGLEFLLPNSLNNFLTIAQNPVLNDISSLERIIQTDTIRIANNPSLSQCEIQTVCKQLNAVPGSVEISDNLTGCNTHAEVLLACAQKPAPASFEYRLYPNPSEGTIRLEQNEELIFINQIDIIDLRGSLVFRRKREEYDFFDYFDLRMLQSGLYHVILYTDSGENRLEKLLLE